MTYDESLDNQIQKGLEVLHEELDKLKMKEVNTVVELDAYKQQLQAYESPLQEVRDSL